MQRVPVSLDADRLLFIKGEYQMIKCEKELEDYIVGDSAFINYIENQLNLKNVELVNRQVHLGDANIADLVYTGIEKTIEESTIIVVELKYRPLEPKDFAQLGRYIDALLTINGSENFDVRGILVGTSITIDVANMINSQILDFNNIEICTVKSKIDYETCVVGWTNTVDINGRIDENLLQKFQKENKK